MLDKENLVYTVFYVLLFLVLVFVAIVIFIYKARSKVFSKEIEIKDLEIKFQKDILLSTIITQEKERERIAKDLHDEISSILNVQSLNLHSLKNEHLNHDQRVQKLETLINHNNIVLESARKIAHNLLPPILDKFGLNTALEELFSEFERSSTLKISYTNTINFEEYIKLTQLHIFRIIQECINNSLKHGKANHIIIVFEKINNKASCTYIDNGIGFNTTKLNKSKGLGMHNIESRIAFLNGELKLESEINKGVKINFNF